MPDTMLSTRADAVVYHPARVSLRQMGGYGPDQMAALRAKLEQVMYDASALDGREPFFFPAEISNNLLDAYDTRMHQTSLHNYSVEAAAGVAMQDSHNHGQLGVGYTLTGNYMEDPATGLVRVVSDFYTMPGLQLATLSTDNFILGVRTGLVRDVSIGFGGGEYRCSICGMDMRDYDCMHWPGMTYSVMDADGNEQAPQRAFAWVVDAHLSEVSAVFDGATPGAGIGRDKAYRMADDGLIKPDLARQLEARYRIKLPVQRQYVVPETPQEAEDIMRELTIKAMVRSVDEIDDAKLSEISDAVLVQFAELAKIEFETALGEERAAPEAAPLPAPEERAEPVVEELEETMTEEQVRALLAEAGAPADVTDVRWFIGELSARKAAAEDGKAYREALIEEALGEAVRAFGAADKPEDFDAESYRAVLVGAPLTSVRKMRDDWKTAGDARFKTGRGTADNAETTPPTEKVEPETRDEFPDDVYRS
jgi:hypothetical protein